VLKLFRRLEQGVHPEVELGAHLTACGLACVPAFGGAVEWDGHAIAIAQELVPEAEDGWVWAGRAAAAGDPAPGARLGEVTRALHAALAGLGARLATTPERAGWRRAAEQQLERAREHAGGSARALLDAH